MICLPKNLALESGVILIEYLFKRTPDYQEYFYFKNFLRGLIIMLFNLDENSKRILEVLEEEGITYTDVITFQFFILHFELELRNDTSKTVQMIESLVKLPKNKKDKLYKNDEDAFKWTIKKLAKRYYKQSELRNDANIAELLKESIIFSFMQDVESLYLDSESSMGQYMKDKNYFQLLNFYLIIQVVTNHPELHENQIQRFFKNEFDPIKPHLNFVKNIKEQGKFDILSVLIQDGILNHGTVLYYFNKTGEDKIEAIISANDYKEIDTKYMKQLEEETLQNWSQKEEERKEYSKTVDKLQSELAEKEKRIKELERELEKYKKQQSSNNFSGSKVLVIGDTQRKDGYKNIIEIYNGEFIFLDGNDDHHLVKEKAQATDVIFHVTDYGSHSVHFQLKKFKKVVFVNNAGLDSLRYAVEDYLGYDCKNCSRSAGNN